MNMEEMINKYFRPGRLPHIWCPGCGNGVVTGSVVKAIAKLDLSKDDVAVISGIGCSSRASGYLDFNTVHSAHGRAIPVATGVKLAEPKLNVIVLTGDGELNEGSNWEAAMSAAQFKLSNIVVFVDNNKCMIDGRVDDEMKVEPLDEKFAAFGFNVTRIDGHNMKQLNDAIEAAIKNHQDGGDKPTAIIMDTYKGAGVDFMQDNYLWHYGSLDDEKMAAANKSLDKYLQERIARIEQEA